MDMKKALFTLLILFGAATFSWAQDISIGSASINKTNRPTLLAAYNMPSDIVRSALADKLKKSKISKGSKAKGGFRAYKGVSIPEISDDKIDVYTKVSGKKDKSTLYFAVSRGYDNFITPETDPEMVNKMKAYVKSMMDNVNIAKLKADIAAQAKVVKSADKAKSSKEKAGSRLQNEQKNLENKLADNKKAQEKNKKEQEEAAKKLSDEEAKLSAIKAKLEEMVK